MDQLGTRIQDAVDPDRIARRLDEIWEIGRTDGGGVTRLAYTDEENEAFDYLLGELSDDYSVTTDEIGNVFATRQPDADRSVFLGSHLDSVYNGGRLDGTLGVIAGLEAIDAADRIDPDPGVARTLAVFRGEESSRFGQHTIGSRGVLGTLTVEDLSAVDEGGVPLWQAMQQAGFQPDNLSTPSIDLDRVATFLEVHIEQGRVLEDAGADVGVVTSIRAPVRYRVTVAGDYDHSGATPMGLRHDAIAGAADLITAVESIAEEAATRGDVVATVGDVTPVGGAINKVCGEVSFPLDVRSVDRPFRESVEAELIERFEAISDRRGLELELEQLSESDPVQLDDGVIDRLEAAAAAVTDDYLRLPSGGGHDAMNFQLAGIPTGMLFTPSVDGISHNPEEATPRRSIEAATRAVANALIDRRR